MVQRNQYSRFGKGNCNGRENQRNYYNLFSVSPVSVANQ